MPLGGAGEAPTSVLGGPGRQRRLLPVLFLLGVCPSPCDLQFLLCVVRVSLFVVFATFTL